MFKKQKEYFTNYMKIYIQLFNICINLKILHEVRLREAAKQKATPLYSG